MAKIFGLFGAGGFAREVMPLARAAMAADSTLYFVETTPQKNQINGIQIISEAEFIAMSGEKTYAIGIADSTVREAIATRMQPYATATSLIANNCFMGDENHFGEGIILCPFTTITSNAKIGKHFHANIYSYIAHDCVIGDYVTFAPNVHCNGNIHIHDHAYIGTGAILRQGTPEKPLVIGRGAVIGMGAVVTKSVDAGVTVIGNPARPMPLK
jgi:sugar O-acyltransferase (sialic acid O-acetyltransferase NeuD family)